MQLPPDDQLVLVSGSPPVRAKKVRYFEDARLRRRVGQAATSSPAASPPDDWSSLKPIAAPAAPVRSPPALNEGDAEEGGLRREPEPLFEDAVQAPATVREFGFFEDEPDDDGEGAEQAALQTRFRRVARQAALDPDDGLEL
jgi:type IV secretion system protein VirD4